MPRLEYYDWKLGRRLPIHSEWSPTERIIYIRGDDPDIEPHVAIAHELGHYKDYEDYSIGMGEEIRAWEEAVYNLMRAGEWNKEVEEQVVWALTGDRENFESEARWWVNRMEQKARQRLKWRES